MEHKLETVCYLCNKHSYLKKHELMYHAEKNVGIHMKDNKQINNTCCFCEKTFFVRSSLKRHIQQQHTHYNVGNVSNVNYYSPSLYVYCSVRKNKRTRRTA